MHTTTIIRMRPVALTLAACALLAVLLFDRGRGPTED